VTLKLLSNCSKYYIITKIVVFIECVTDMYVYCIFLFTTQELNKCHFLQNICYVATFYIVSVYVFDNLSPPTGLSLVSPI